MENEAIFSNSRQSSSIIDTVILKSQVYCHYSQHQHLIPVPAPTSTMHVIPKLLGTLQNLTVRVYLTVCIIVSRILKSPST